MRISPYASFPSVALVWVVAGFEAVSASTKTQFQMTYLWHTKYYDYIKPPTLSHNVYDNITMHTV